MDVVDFRVMGTETRSELKVVECEPICGAGIQIQFDYYNYMTVFLDLDKVKRLIDILSVIRNKYQGEDKND